MAEMMMMAGSLASVGGALAQGEGQRGIHNYNAQLARNEAKQGQRAAQFSIEQNTERTNRLLGMQRAQIAKSGFDIAGSPLLLMEETARMGSLENQMLQYQADLQSANMAQAAKTSRRQGKNARIGGVLNAGGGLLTGLGNLGVGLNNLTGGLNSGTSTVL
jgi:hypothetical protein